MEKIYHTAIYMFMTICNSKNRGKIHLIELSVIISSISTHYSYKRIRATTIAWSSGYMSKEMGEILIFTYS
jgi:hypothetical protein